MARWSGGLMKHIKENNSVYDPKTKHTWFLVPAFDGDHAYGRCVLRVDHNGHCRRYYETTSNIDIRETVQKVLAILDPELPTTPGTIIYSVFLKREVGASNWAVLGENGHWYLSKGTVSAPISIKHWEK